ncbi:L,D-transpeptidase [Streptomyces graminilatus]|uniref:L,D-transpeptidase n=1 Tax=Streptomyces graminilatus TaxID=1464070 RepID=UPI0006E29E8F|nr:Ig-like domain-containing protein [Streptomyces graminilatus]
MTTPHTTARRALGACAVLMVGALTLTACGGDNSGSGDGKGGGSGKGGSGSVSTAVMRIAISAKDGSEGASINTTGVKVDGGTLTDVRMTVAETGAAVAGAISADGLSWRPERQLERGTRYRIAATAKDAEGRTRAADSTFTTVTKENSFIGSYTPEEGTTVGVGMPVSFTFDKEITDLAAVRSHITVTSSSGQQVVGHWFGAQRLDFRPEEYWKAGSKVTMKIDLDGVKGANGAVGVQKKTVSFTIGRSQVSTVDIATQTMTVVRDGQELKRLPISAGSPEFTTYNGQMVISEKLEETRMDSRTVDLANAYDIPDVPHAMRLTSSGTFMHGNYWYNEANPPFGNTGTSHGCVGLEDVQGGSGDTPAKWMFDESMIGDVVIVKGSADKQVAPDNGFNGWNMPWSEWTADAAS